MFLRSPLEKIEGIANLDTILADAFRMYNDLRPSILTMKEMQEASNLAESESSETEDRLRWEL